MNELFRCVELYEQEVKTLRQENQKLRKQINETIPVVIARNKKLLEEIVETVPAILARNEELESMLKNMPSADEDLIQKNEELEKSLEDLKRQNTQLLEKQEQLTLTLRNKEYELMSALRGGSGGYCVPLPSPTIWIQWPCRRHDGTKCPVIPWKQLLLKFRLR